MHNKSDPDHSSSIQVGYNVACILFEIKLRMLLDFDKLRAVSGVNRCTKLFRKFTKMKEHSFFSFTRRMRFVQATNT